MTLARGRFADLFGLASELGPYDLWPVLTPEIDPQVYVSLNDRPQPFHLVHERDAVLVHLSGSARVEFAAGPVRYFELADGDHVYVPAGVAYRMRPATPSLQVLYKAEPAGLEAVVWHCDECGREVYRDDFDTAAEVPQRAYARISRAFNADVAHRRCPHCRLVHGPVDLEGYRWLELAERLETYTEQPARA